MEYKNVSFTATLKIHPSYLQFIKYKRQTIDINSIRQHIAYYVKDVHEHYKHFNIGYVLNLH